MFFSTSAATLLAVIINLSSTAGINVNSNQLLRLRHSNDSDAHEVQRELYGWGQGITTDVQTDCKEIFAGWNEVCILVCTKVTSIMNGDELVDEYSSVSQQKCEENGDEDGWQSSGLVDLDSGNSNYSKSSKSKSVGGSSSGSSSGSKSSKSKSGGSGSSYTGSKSSKSGDYSKSSKGSGSYSKISKGSDSYSKSSKSGGGGSASGDIASDWGTTTVRASPNDWSASWSNGYHHYSNPNINIKQGGYSKSSKGSGSYSKSSKSDGAGSGSADFSKSSKGSSSYSKGSKGSIDTGYYKSKSGGGRSGSDTWSAPINLVS
jgi:hypothetical protein